jgi:hypothetical protein
LAENRGAQISGLTRSSDRAAQLRDIGLDVFGTDGTEGDEHRSWPRDAVEAATQAQRNLGDATQQFIADKMSTTTHFLSTVAPDMCSDPILSNYRDHILGTTTLTWLGYLSSTSVYGEHDGAWVSESTESIMPGQRGLARLEAESGWRDLSTELNDAMKTKLRFNIFRLAGIYGPGRSAIDTILKRPVAMEGAAGAEKLTSRIHVEDIVEALTASALHPNAGDIYNLADDLPATRVEVFEFARQLVRDGAAGSSSATRLRRLERDLIKQGSTQNGSDDTYKQSRRTLERASKRVCNHHLKSALLPRLQFPTYRHGLAKVAADLAASDPTEERLST